MVEATDSRFGNHSPQSSWFNRSLDGGVPIQREVAAVLVVIREVPGEDPPKVVLVEDDHVVEAVPADRADEPLDGKRPSSGVVLGRIGCR